MSAAECPCGHDWMDHAEGGCEWRSCDCARPSTARPVTSGLPEVGALVEVTATGTVQRHGVDGTGFMITVEGGRAWIPACATVKVLQPPRPSEVLLLDCGHLTDGEPAVGRVYCWKYPCHGEQNVTGVGSVTW